MKALVIGSGICGPVTAVALQRAGLETTIYEAHSPAGGAGSYLTVATNGIRALSALDAHGPVVEASFATSHSMLWSGNGKLLGTVPIGSTADAALYSRTIRRSSLQQTLRDLAVARGVRIEYAKRLTHADTTAHGVVAHFDDGTAADGDLLIGCDGVRSVTRRLVDVGAPGPRYVGLLNFGGYTAGTTVAAPGAWHMIFGRRAFFGYATDERGGTIWFANVPRQPITSAERAATSAAQWQQRLVAQFGGDHGPAAELIARGTLELAGDNTHDLPPVPIWSRGRMLIIGDAAHAPSPSSGQGASMAIEDAIVLGACLRATQDVAAAFSRFETLRRARVERIVAFGARSSSSKAAGPIGRVLRDLTLPFVFRHFVTEK